jgi:hypothetical protein
MCEKGFCLGTIRQYVIWVSRSTKSNYNVSHQFCAILDHDEQSNYPFCSGGDGRIAGYLCRNLAFMSCTGESGFPITELCSVSFHVKVEAAS